MRLYKFCNVITRHLSSRSGTPKVKKMSTNCAKNGEINFEDIDNYLKKYEGGEIYISKEYWDRGIAVININNPSRKNAINGNMMVDLRRCVTELEKWEEGKAVLLRGLGENFSSGGDLHFARATGNPEGSFNMSTAMQDALTRLKALPMLSVSLVHGATLGGAAEVSIFCDHLLASRDARLGFVHGKMGLITAWGATTRLVQLLGERKALDVLLTSTVMNADQLLEVGLASQLVENETKLEQALEFIEARTRHHHSIVRSFKMVVHAAAKRPDQDEVLAFEKKLFCPFWGGELNRKALSQNIKHVKTNKES